MKMVDRFFYLLAMAKKVMVGGVSSRGATACERESETAR